MIEVRRVEGDADVDTWIAIRNAVEPQTPQTRERLLTRRGRPLQLELLGCLDGEAVGAATSARHFVDPDSPLAFASVRVLAHARRRGVGTALLAEISRYAQATGRTGLYTAVREDDGDSLGYYGRRGFAEVLRMQASALDLATADAAMPDVEGVELVRLSERDLLAELYDAALEIERDLVADRPWRTGTLAEWREKWLGPPTLPDCSFAALAGGRVVGYALLEDEGHGTAGHAMTGVRRGWRGRGLATALKQAQVVAARDAGLRELLATNEVGNAPMRGVNTRLGYVPRVAYVHLAGPLVA